ncbi:mechanosensitive ion channel family protein [Streptococcus intermedius]|uniref:mechanosensitive ion channel family protein n=1 Tax=Streptococcus intermedius TaxID=1338 RepID=UPI0006CB62B5|nr:mechanosensitive ion channel family protein [Streptococcus intermedius]ALF27150.1 mechanosensitive ion channel protein [Streptococcus intermedius]ARC26475.1 mechanosensitive ion channel family protein [Streptococcus intermedius]PMR63858.1 mechanosensitive channel protein [Streptococcus intermedius]WOI90441.1 mechanosensitive ion channel family protein [Streptococcus intermedius]
MFLSSNIFSRYFKQFNWTTILDDAFSKLISLLFLLILFYIAKKLLHVFVSRIISPSLKFSSSDIARQKTISRLIENVLNYALYFLLIYWILSILGLPVSSLLAGAGIAGVAIGMGAQGFLSDLVNGFFILLERQLDVGDSVRLTNGSIKIAGAVVSVGIRTTQVRDADGTLHYVPNRNITVVSNLSRGNMRALIDIPLYAQTDLEKVTRIIQQVNQDYAVKQAEILQEPIILGPQLGDNGQFYFRVSITVQSGTQSTVYHQFYRLYHDALLKGGIDLPTIYTLA